MIREKVFDIVGVAWPSIVIFLVILSIIRICYLINNHKKFSLYKELMTLLFIAYILLLFELVTFKDNAIASGVNLTPFKEILRYKIGSDMFISQIIGNIVIFIPFGFFASYYVNAKKAIFPLVITTTASSIIEIVQHYIGRSFDIDDIILNVVGGMVGYLLFGLVVRMRKQLPNFLQKDWFYDVVLVILIAIMVLYFLNYLEIWGL